MPFRARKAPKLLDEDELYQYAVSSLARQMRTVAELKRLMSRRVEEGEVGQGKMAAVVVRLADQRYLDDGAFASNYTRLRQENQSFGKRRVQQELTRKGVPADLISTTLDAAYAQTSDEELARRYIERKRIQKPKDDKETNRLIRRLVGAGFCFANISQVLKNWQVDVTLPEDGVAE